MWKKILCSVIFAATLTAQQKEAQKPQEPPEEDESLKPKEYGFNPVQALSDIKVGLFYFKKGRFLAASKRFEEATKWDPNSAEAYLRLGEAKEKLKDPAGAKAAYAKYLEIVPDSKLAPALRKKMEHK